MRRIVCTADKGGVGKTTTIANMAVYLSLQGEKVLVVDVDGQGDVTYALLGNRPPAIEKHKTIYPSMYGLMIEQSSFDEVVVSAPKYASLDVLPANKDLDRAPLLLANDPGGTTVLKRILDELPQDAYDYVLIDTAKGRDLLLINAVAAAEDVLIMLTPGTLEIDAVERTIEHVEAVRTRTLLGAERPQVMGILMSRAEVRGDSSIETLTVSAQKLIEQSHPGLLFSSVIPEAVDYRKAISQATSIFEYEARKRQATGEQTSNRYTVRGRRSAEAYENFVEEVRDYGQG